MEAQTNSSKQLKTRISDSLLSGFIMGVCAVLVWFLLSTSAKRLGMVILGALLLLIIVNFLCLALVKQKQQSLRLVVRNALIVVNILAMLCIAIYAIAPSQLFYPHFDEESYQTLQVKDSAEQLQITVGGQTISGWMLRNANGKAPLILYFGGNGENASSRILSMIEKNRQAMFKGYNFAFLDYPGYGKSSGSPSEDSLKQMGLDTFDALSARSDVDPKHIVAFGYSMGTGVANYVASNRNVAGLILMAPYADGYDLYNGMINIFHGPLRLLVGFRMESVRFAEHIYIQPLILASKSDEWVSYKSSVRLSEAYPVGCRLESFDGLKHNDFWGTEAVREQISDYLAEVLRNG